MEDLMLNFMHPQYGTVFQVSVSLEYSIKEIIELLESVGFIPTASKPQYYTLSLYGKQLNEDLSLYDLDEIEDGDIIKVNLIKPVIAATEETNKNTPKIYSCWLSLPQMGVIPWKIEEDCTASDLLEDLEAGGFLTTSLDKYEILLQGKEIWGADSNAKDNNINSQSLIAIKLLEDEQSITLNEMQGNLNLLKEQILQMQENLNSELTVIRNKIPLPYTIPIDVERASLNPTQFVYQNLDGLLNDIRKTGKLPPFQKIEPINIIPWIIIGVVSSIFVILIFILIMSNL